jgi:hypothetical protein
MQRARNTRTDKDMEQSGQWAKADKVGGKQSWHHESGDTVAWDCMAWCWRVNGGEGFGTLVVARTVVEAAHR